jgi:tRNA(Ile)-lysidine synthase
MLLAHAAGLDVAAVHIDHGLRHDSSLDKDIIQPIADSLGIPLQIHSVRIEDGPNLEARAREARYGIFTPETMTGHTADDQAETVLINLLRGAGAQGLSAMKPGNTRPLLALRRSETHALCAELGITPVDDYTNSDPRFLRNRVRHELLTLMTDISQRDPVPLLARTADVLRSDNDLLDELAAQLDPTDALALAAAPAPLARRAIRQWLAHPYPPDLKETEMPPKLRGKWALGITPRNFTWVIKDCLAICERPGGYGDNHRRVRRQEEIIWLRENHFDLVISIIAAPHNLHAYEELNMPYRHRPLSGADDTDAFLRTFYKELQDLLGRNTKMMIHAEEVGDRLLGIIGGYIRWSGMVDDPSQAIIITERIGGRQLDTWARELILGVHNLR